MTLEGWIQISDDVVRPAQLYSRSIIGKAAGSTAGDNLDGCVHEKIVKIARAADLMNPSVAVTVDKAKAMADLSYLSDYCPFISVDQLAAMEQEWDQYKVLSANVQADQNVLAFFKLHKDLLPAIAGVVCDLAQIPSSSAACERVFSLLRNVFGKRQYHSLQDYISMSVMLRSNKSST